MTVAQVRDRFNTSRKYALAIMEYLDDRKITRRVGDERVLRLARPISARLPRRPIPSGRPRPAESAMGAI